MGKQKKLKWEDWDNNGAYQLSSNIGSLLNECKNLYGEDLENKKKELGKAIGKRSRHYQFRRKLRENDDWFNIDRTNWER